MAINSIGNSYTALPLRTPAVNQSKAAASDNQSPAQLLKTATDSVFKMADLLKRARDLSNDAASLRGTDASGLERANTQLSSMLKEISAIGLDTKAQAPTKVDKNAAPPTLGELRTTLNDMQSTLRENIRKVGYSSMSAINSGAFNNPSTPSANVSNAWTSWVASLKVQQKYF